jgi:hypothetical protein
MAAVDSIRATPSSQWMPVAFDAKGFVSPTDPSPFAWMYAVHSQVGDNPHYCVGTDGGLWSRYLRRRKDPTDRWTRIGTGVDRSGYHLTSIRGRTPKTTSVHEAVLTTFVGPCPPGMQCRHLNGRRTDNRLLNLAWGTPQENGKDKIRHGTARGGCCRGIANHLAKFSDETIAMVRQLIGEKAPSKQIALLTGVSVRHIQSIASKQRRRA